MKITLGVVLAFLALTCLSTHASAGPCEQESRQAWGYPGNLSAEDPKKLLAEADQELKRHTDPDEIAYFQCVKRYSEEALGVNRAAGTSKANPATKAARDFGDGTHCIALSAANDTGVSFWENHCGFPVMIAWADTKCRTGFACGSTSAIQPGGKEAAIVAGRYVAAACEYPGLVRAPDGGRWKPMNARGRHSCK
ncbi:hypothetical protein [Pandoraea sp. NPDC090278]|uniref:hypothetical protein n=1 Tax=Pandoraea sp. NPDC090278 TaxID=3364391 RepID=UPI00383ADC5C